MGNGFPVIRSHLESTHIKYILAARFTLPVQRLKDNPDARIGIDDGIQIFEKFYQHAD